MSAALTLEVADHISSSLVNYVNLDIAIASSRRQRRDACLQQSFPRCGSSCSVSVACCATASSEQMVEKSPAGSDWIRLDEPLLWQGPDTDAQSNEVTAVLSPGFKVMLLSDGSVTRHLQLITGRKIRADCIDMGLVPTIADLPKLTSVLQGPLIQRQALLRAHSTTGSNGSTRDSLGPALVYATSWWNAKDGQMFLAERARPIGTSLLGSELRREITSVFHGHSKELERAFGDEGPFWGRLYTLWREGKPLTVIYEVFSPALQRSLNPPSVRQPAQS